MIDKITYLETDSAKFPLAFTLNVMEALQEAYWRAKIKNKRHIPKKYRKDNPDNTEKNSKN